MTAALDTSALPQSGEPIILPDGTTATVAWCSGWTWPVGLPAPTVLYAQPETPAGVLAIELRVVAARDVLGQRFWLAERRALARSLSEGKPGGVSVPPAPPRTRA